MGMRPTMQRDGALKRIAQGRELRAHRRIEPFAHRILHGYARTFVQVVFVMVHLDGMAEAIGAHAVDAEAEHGVLNGGIACHHHGFDAALAGIAAELLDHLVGRIARSRKHDPHARDTLARTVGKLVARAVEHDDGLEIASRMTELLKQNRYNPLAFEEEAVAVYCGGKGFLDDVDVKNVVRFRDELIVYLRASHADVLKQIREDAKFTPESEKALNAAIDAFKKQFAA